MYADLREFCNKTMLMYRVLFGGNVSVRCRRGEMQPIVLFNPAPQSCQEKTDILELGKTHLYYQAFHVNTISPTLKVYNL